MTEIDQIIENLITTDGIHPFVFICEAADKYLPIIASLEVMLENGSPVSVTAIDPDVAVKVDETRKLLRREDRIVWALRFFKKALAEELLWLCRNEPQFFVKRFKSGPYKEQPQLERQIRKLQAVDLTPFYEGDLNEFESPYLGLPTIDAINSRLSYYIKVAESSGKNDQSNPINALRLDYQTFGEVVSAYRRGEIELRHSNFPGGIEMMPTPEGPYDMRDKEGPVETIVKFPDGWRWLDLHRNHSPLRDDRSSPSDTAITGHCANVAGKCGETAFELVEPLGNNKWKHHAFFVLHPDGSLGEMKGRKNQKPSPRLEKYIFELLRRIKRIKGLGGHRSWESSHDFALSDLTKPHLEILTKERPDLVKNAKAPVDW